MFSNTTALDIAIGLIFVYFIYSLLVSIIAEMLSSWMGIRARLLRQGIDNLLNDQVSRSLKTDFTKWMKDVLMIEYDAFRYSAAGRFYQEPGIRSLAKRGQNETYSIRNTKPSYISKQLYAKTILTMFNRKGRGVNERDRVFMAVETNALHLQTETNKRFVDMLAASNGDFSVFTTHLEDEYSEMMDRVNGWYKRKLGFMLFWIGFLICVVLHVDTFRIVNILSSNPAVRRDMVQLASDAAKGNESVAAWMQASADSVAYFNMISESYGKAFRDAREAEFLLAQGWDFDGEQKTVLLKDSSKIMQVKEILSKSNTLLDSIAVAKKAIGTHGTSGSELKAKIEKYYLLQADYKKAVLEPVSELFHENILSIDVKDIDAITPLVFTVEPGFFYRIKCVFGEVFAFWKSTFWGIVLSALALSLGANFWFDLLKRLVAIRSAGVKPEEKETPPTLSVLSAKAKRDGMYTDIHDHVEKALSDHRRYWESLAGVAGVNRAVISVAGRSEEGIEIVVDENEFVPGKIPRQVSVDIRGVVHKVFINIVPGKVGVLSEDIIPKPGHIFHPKTNQCGTPAGIVYNTVTKSKAILTCAHQSIRDFNVLISEQSSDEAIYLVENSIQTIDKKLGYIGNRIYSSYIDAAAIDIPDALVTSSIRLGTLALPVLKKPLEVDSIHQGTLDLRVATTRGYQYGKLTHAFYNHTFRPANHPKLPFRNLIRFGKYPDYDAFITEAGDSGALIETMDGQPVAILIGAAEINHKKYSFGVKLTDIMEALQLKLI